MIKITDLLIESYKINLEFTNSIYGIFSRDKKMINHLLLCIAGISKSDGACTYNENYVYDLDSYFKERIYIDFQNEYFETTQAFKIIKGVKQKYNLEVDNVELVNHFKKLNVRGECEITSKYNLTNTGINLVNAAFCLATKQHLLINNPTIYLNKQNDITYIFNEFLKKKRMVILGLDSLQKPKGFLEKIVIFSDYSDVIVFDANAYVYVIDNTYNLSCTKLFVSKDGLRQIVYGLSKEEFKACEKYKMNPKKVLLYDIEAYL